LQILTPHDARLVAPSRVSARAQHAQTLRRAADRISLTADGAVDVGGARQTGLVAAPHRFSPATQAWLDSAFAAPTPAQEGAWQAVARGEHTLVVAPTGSGKTLAAFLSALDRLAALPKPDDPLRRCRVLYVSPLKALAVDVERNLRAPLTGIRQAAARLALPEPDVTIALRSGDTSAEERRLFARRPADILITTPESLFLLLTSNARESLRGVDTVIVDEVHAVCSTKRGAHLAVSLERLDALLAAPAQRIGLSATVRPVDEVATFLAGGRPVTVVQPEVRKQLSLEVVVPVEDLSAIGEPTDDLSGAAAGAQRRASIWPHVEERVLDLVEAHRSTIVFANSRRLAERLTARLNELASERAGVAVEHDPAPAQVMAQAGSAAPAGDIVVARAHHGSVSREQRVIVEEQLKSGTLPAVVATSSLELGIDMGAVDLVVQVESPPSVAAGLQRVGRAGHQVGAVSEGVIFPKFRGDLVECAVVAERMRDGLIEAMRYPRNPLDVLAQHIVAMVAMEPLRVDDVEALVRRAAPFAGLPRSALEAVLDMLAGRYPSDAFAELRPRLVWDRVSGELTARRGAQRLAVTSGGTIPDRGLFGVFLAGAQGPGRRVGELDEEMVYESRVGDVFLLGSSSWRIEDITHDRVLVTPAPGEVGRMPFWKGDSPGRPAELGRALGAFLRELSGTDEQTARARAHDAGLDEWGTDNLLAYLAEQRVATGRLPDDRTVLVERFRDELGDWRLVIHSPFGAPVNAPWALAIAARLRERYGLEVSSMHSDDGIVLRLPETDAEPPGGDIAVFEADEVEALVTSEVGGSALFASRFRECAARALLLPRRDPRRRTPLWQQRQRANQLLQVASEYGDFPVVLEAMRECLQDVFDLPGLVALMRDLAARRVRLVEVETAAASPFARSLLFGYVGLFLYEGDAPLAERRAQALSLDSALLAELLGATDLRELLDHEALAEVELEIGRLAADRHARGIDGVHDLLRVVGDLTTDEALARGATPHDLAELEASRRALRVRIASELRWLAVEDAGRVRDALGTALPVGVPEAFTEPVRDPLGDLLSRYARTHGPFVASDVAERLGLGVAVVNAALARLAAVGRVVQGEFRPGGIGTEWCDAEVLRAIRRRSLAALRREVEPVPQEALARFIPSWQGLGARATPGAEGLLRAVEQLAGAPLPASALESLVLPSRVAGYSPALLDELTLAGEVVWTGAGSVGGNDGWLVLAPADVAPLLLPPADAIDDPLALRVYESLAGDEAVFFRALAGRVVAHGAETDEAIARAMWELVWSGLLTNDTLAPVRAMLGQRNRAAPARRPRGATVARRRYGRYAGLTAPGGTTALRPAPFGMGGRWSAAPQRDEDATRRALAAADVLLDRHGIVTRAAVTGERLPGGFPTVYPVLKAAEEAGRVRRGYFVDGLGAAQFALPGAVDRLRSEARPIEVRAGCMAALVLPATDPANPYGAALPWPAAPRASEGGHQRGHQPARKAGALVVLVDGRCVLYVERGGRTLLSFTDDPAILQPAADALALAVRDGALGRLQVERADGAPVTLSALGDALTAAGFRPTPRGLRLRG
jgi:ATP-dependent Lhr-like helicase